VALRLHFAPGKLPRPSPPAISIVLSPTGALKQMRGAQNPANPNAEGDRTVGVGHEGSLRSSSYLDQKSIFDVPEQRRGLELTNTHHMASISCDFQ
jgi:hypothetical protein